MALSLPQQTDGARQLAPVLFGANPFNLILQSVQTATVNHADILAAVQQLDTDLDTTLTAATAALGGATTIINGLNASIPSPASTLTAQQKTIILCAVLLKRAGLI